MIVSAPSDYREAARRRLPDVFSFSIILTVARWRKITMNANAARLASVALRQRVLCGAGETDAGDPILLMPHGRCPWRWGRRPSAPPGCTPAAGCPGGPGARRLPRRDPVHLIHRVGLLD